jgi:hypothetical protein
MLLLAEAAPYTVKLPADVAPAGAKIATRRERPRMFTPVSWSMTLFKKALGRLRKSNTHRRQKNLKKITASRGNPKTNPQPKRKGPVALKNRKLFIPLY